MLLIILKGPLSQDLTTIKLTLSLRLTWGQRSKGGKIRPLFEIRGRHQRCRQVTNVFDQVNILAVMTCQRRGQNFKTC